MKGSDRYFIRKIEMCSNVSSGVSPQELGLTRMFKRDKDIIEGMDVYTKNGLTFSIYLAKATVIPTSQDWAWAFKYSFRNYAAPVDYVLILIGLILLVLAGRAKE